MIFCLKEGDIQVGLLEANKKYQKFIYVRMICDERSNHPSEYKI